MAARGEIDADEALAMRYRLPTPRLDLCEVLRRDATAAADVSDGLAADAGHIGEVSGVRLDLDLDRMPVSDGAGRWLKAQPDRASALGWLAAGGDDYEVVATFTGPAPEGFTAIGLVSEGEGLQITAGGRPLNLERRGWRHA
jgi:thiamine-monophosphate kinase